MGLFRKSKKILLDKGEKSIILIMRERLDKGFLLPEIDKTAQLAISSALLVVLANNQLLEGS